MKKTMIAVGLAVVLFILLVFVFLSLGGSISFGSLTIGNPAATDSVGDGDDAQDVPSEEAVEPNLFVSADGQTTVRVAAADGLITAIISQGNAQSVTAPLDKSVVRVSRVDFLPGAKVALTGYIDGDQFLHEVFSAETGASVQRYFGGSFVYDMDANLYFAVSEDNASDRIMMNGSKVVFDAGMSMIDKNSLFIEEGVLYLEAIGVTGDEPCWRYGLRLKPGPGAAGVALAPNGKALPSNERNVITSPDGTMSVYINDIDPMREKPVSVALVLNRKKIVVSMNAQVRALTDAVFMGNNMIALTGHVNPDFSIHEIFDVQTGAQYGGYLGYGFTHDGGGRVFYVETPKEGINTTYRIRDAAGAMLFEAAASDAILDSMRIEGDTLYFYTRDRAQTTGAGMEQSVVIGLPNIPETTPENTEVSTESTETENGEEPTDDGTAVTE